MTQQIALEYLTKNALLNMDMIESIRMGEAEILEASARGVLLFHTVGEEYMISTDSGDSARQMLGRVTRADAIVIHQEHSLPLVKARFGFDGRTECLQAVYTGETPLPEPDRPFEIRTLDESDLPFVSEHYSRGSDEEYLTGRLRAGVIKGAFFGDEIAGFIGMHAEGAMGMLEVLPRYRRRGIAFGLETHYANELMRSHRTPYAQIIVGNDASVSLHRKLDFAIAKGTVSWLYKSES